MISNATKPERDEVSRKTCTTKLGFGRSFPYYVKIEMDNGEVVTEKVVDKRDEKRLDSIFPDLFIDKR